MFYGWWDWRFLFLLVFSTLLDYFSGIQIEKSKSVKESKFWFWLSIIINLGFLGIFKYYNFFATSFTELINGFGFQVNPVLIKVILPVGISFYTFHGLSYVIDIYYKRIKAETNFIDYSLFVSYFPLLVAGPIERATHLLPQVKVKREFNFEKAKEGVHQIIWGLVKKVVIADSCALYANEVFNHQEQMNSSSLLLGAIYFAFQIYGDFSGYSDIALGTSKLFGIDLLKNFNFPYFSRDIAEFWRRWHISLSTWLRDYLYISMGGNRKGKLRTYLNLAITMLIGGLWHGAALKFIVWGALHGLALTLHKLWSENIKLPASRWGNYVSILITFHFVAFCWMYFRAADMYTVKLMLNNISTHFDFAGIGTRVLAYWKVFALILTGFAVHFLPSNLKNRAEWWYSEASYTVKIVLFVMVIVVIYQATSSDLQPFIYFQF